MYQSSFDFDTFVITHLISSITLQYIIIKKSSVLQMYSTHYLLHFELLKYMIILKTEDAAQE